MMCVYVIACAANAGESGGLSQEAKIGLGVGLGVGLFLVIVILVVICCCCKLVMCSSTVKHLDVMPFSSIVS